MSVRVRYAPSPTGEPHLGVLRTAIFDYLFAKANNGVFIVRQEDTDQARSVPGSFERILESLNWLGTPPDEGMMLTEDGQLTEKGDFGPYTQSKRLDIYKKYSDQLIEAGKAYRCFCTSERLEQMRADQQAQKLPPRYDRHCRNLTPEESLYRSAEKHVVRQAMPLEGTIVVKDLLRGDIEFQAADMDDHVLLKTDGFPTYQLANVVDDHLMEITHVLRGEEWISSGPKNVLLYQSFGWEPPVWVHLPLVLGPDKAKLSKRHGAEPVLSYRDRGYLPEAILNVLAFIGWSPGTEEEFFTKNELIQHFKLEKAQKAAAVFNLERLDFVNGWYIRHLAVGDVAEHMQPYLDKAGITIADPHYLLTVARILQERLKHFDETVEVSWFFFKRPEVTDELRQLTIPKKGDAETTHRILGEVVDFLSGLAEGQWKLDILQELLYSFTESHHYKNMEVLWPIRAALTGVQASPGTFEMLIILGKEESLERLRAVLSVS
jgi:glutamyl-tRNA synthetase